MLHLLRSIHPTHRPTFAELHLNKDAQFTHHTAAQVVASGGSYERARKHNDFRKVTVPIENEKLINGLLRRYRCKGGSTVLLRGGGAVSLPEAIVTMTASRGQYLEDAIAEFKGKLSNAIDLGIVESGEEIQAREDAWQAERDREAQVEKEAKEALAEATRLDSFLTAAKAARCLTPVRQAAIYTAIVVRLQELAAS